MTGTGKLIVVRGKVNTIMLPILHFEVLRDHSAYVPGNVLLINQERYWIRARQPDAPRPNQTVKLVLYRDYTTRPQRLAQRKRDLKQLQAASFSRAFQEHVRAGYTMPTFENPTAERIGDVQ